HPKVRLPGGGGAPEIAASCKETLVMLRQSSRAFVERLDFRTTVGYGDGPGGRERLGLKGRGVSAVITDLGVLEPNPASCELVLGLPQSVAGVTMNRLCASGLAAVVSACHAVVAGDGDLFVAGGVESMSRAPLVTGKPDKAFPRGDRSMYDTTLGWRFPNPRLEAMFPLESMGETGENVAERWGVSREDQDAFALESHKRAVAAAEAGRFDDELVTVEAPQPKGPPVTVHSDEGPRPDASAESLAKLRPVFRE